MPGKKQITIEGGNPLENINVLVKEGDSHAKAFCSEIRRQTTVNPSKWDLSGIGNTASEAVSGFFGSGLRGRAAKAAIKPLVAALPDLILTDTRQKEIKEFLDRRPPAGPDRPRDPLRGILFRQAKTMEDFSEGSLIPYGIAMHELEAELVERLSGVPAMTARAAVHRYNHAIAAMFARKMRDVISIIEESHGTHLAVVRPVVKVMKYQPAIAGMLLEKMFLAANPQIFASIFESDRHVLLAGNDAERLEQRMRTADRCFSEIQDACLELFEAAIDGTEQRVERNVRLLQTLEPRYLGAMRAEAELGDRLTDGGAMALLAAVPD